MAGNFKGSTPSGGNRPKTPKCQSFFFFFMHQKKFRVGDKIKGSVGLPETQVF